MASLLFQLQTLQLLAGTTFQLLITFQLRPFQLHRLLDFDNAESSLKGGITTDA